MRKNGLMGMRAHQCISFSPLMMRIPAGRAVFWPGCALMTLETGLLEKTLEVLRRAEPEISMAACCCGQPTRYLFPERLEKRQKRLLTRLKKGNVQRIYTACPNCTLQLRELNQFEIIPIWPVLAARIHLEDLVSGDGKKYIWHDPCPTRGDAGQQKAVRELLAIRNCSCIEPEHSGGRTLCCGNFHMLHTLSPEKSAAIRQKRLAEFPEDRIILSSCEGCLGAFRKGGREARHLLELLFGVSSRRGWSNRLKITFLCK